MSFLLVRERVPSRCSSAFPMQGESFQQTLGGTKVKTRPILLIPAETPCGNGIFDLERYRVAQRRDPVKMEKNEDFRMLLQLWEGWVSMLQNIGLNHSMVSTRLSV